MHRVSRLFKRRERVAPVIDDQRNEPPVSPRLDLGYGLISVPTLTNIKPKPPIVQEDSQLYPASRTQRREEVPTSTQPFKRHFPTDIFRIIIEIYLHDCHSNEDLRGISLLARSCHLLYLLLEPEVFRFVPFRCLGAFIASPRTLKTARQYTKALDMSTVDQDVFRMISRMGPVTEHPWLLFLQGSLERLCLPMEHATAHVNSQNPLVVRDVTLFYNVSRYQAAICCQRLRLTMEHEDDYRNLAIPLIFNPFNHHYLYRKGLTSLAYELADEPLRGSLTLRDIYDGFNNISKLYALQHCVVIIWFPSHDVLERFRQNGRMLELPRPQHLHVAYLLRSEHKQWTFRALEWSGEDFWEKIQSRFEPLR